MDETAALAIDDIISATLTRDGEFVLLRLNAGGHAIDLTFPIAKAGELVAVLTDAVVKASRNRVQ